MSSKYTVNNIYEMEQIEQLRQNTGMFIGSTENPTRLVEELLDNALDEVQSGHCKILGVFIDTKEHIYKVLDAGRGFPFDEKMTLEEDRPILTATRLFTSGKFKKGDDDSAYKIAAGLHGIGNVAVYALSEFMEIEIYRDNKHALYKFDSHSTKEPYNRIVEPYKGERPFSTKVTFKPHKNYFNILDVDLKTIEERLRIAVANYPELKIVFRVDEKDLIIKGSEQDLILDYLTKNDRWIEFNNTKGPESCYLKICWDDEPPVAPKVLSCVNLIRVHSGVHINKLNNILKNVFEALSKKYNYDFKPEDCLSYLRVYLNLKIIKTSFEAQVKVKLESKSDLSVMDGLESALKKHFEQNPEYRDELLTKFQDYRRSLQTKGVKKTKSGKRSTTKFTKLADCTGKLGELIIGEGDSAVGGLIQVRNEKKHAILPLRGVIANAVTKKDLLNSEEIKDIVDAIGTGINGECNIEHLRYSKIILAADADPAGKFITALLIVLFAKLTPAIIKAGKLYICETPLFTTRINRKLVPLWTDEQRKDAQDKKLPIHRHKGLGEFLPKDLKVFILEEEFRKLHQVTWSENVDHIFKLMSSSSEKRKLADGEWSLETKQ